MVGMSVRATGPQYAWSGRVAAVLVVAALVLAGCSGGSTTQAEEPSASPTESGTGEPYLDVAKDVELTDPGTELEVGETATIAWKPTQQKIGVLEVTVTRLEKTGFGVFEHFKIDKQTRKRQPYFVTVRVTNVGKTNLSGVRIPLYVLGEDNKLVPASRFEGTFKTCPSEPLPKGFEPGASTTACLVYLVPDKGDLTAVVFRPSQGFLPITWTGEVTRYGKDGTKKDGKKDGTKKDGSKTQQGQRQQDQQSGQQGSGGSGGGQG